MTTATFRLDPGLAMTLQRLAEKRGQTKSEVLRDALTCFARIEGEEPPPGSDTGRFNRFAGVFDSGNGQLSRDTGRKFRELMQEKRRSRSSR